VALLIRLRKFVALPAGERRLLVLAAGVLPLTALGLRVAAFERVLAVLGRLAGRRPLEVEGPDVARRAQRTEQLVCWAARHGLHRGNCLSQSLTLWWALRRQGIVSDLRFGVYKDTGRLEAHAWIECAGRVLSDRGGVRQRVVAFEGAIPHDTLRVR
jgi:Transglutaminase-like superfamily